MPLSKKRDRERKRLARLESKNVQPSNVMPDFVRKRDQALTYIEIDADGQPIYEE